MGGALSAGTCEITSGALGCVLGGLSDQPGKRDERGRRKHELGGRAEIGGVVENDRERPEQQADEESATNHEREP